MCGLSPHLRELQLSIPSLPISSPSAAILAARDTAETSGKPHAYPFTTVSYIWMVPGLALGISSSLPVLLGLINGAVLAACGGAHL